MPTQCTETKRVVNRLEGRVVVAEFDGGELTSDAGALLLGRTDESLRLLDRLSGCFKDARDPQRVEHSVRTLLMQRVVGIALGYEDLNDHDQLRHDPVLSVLAGKLEAHDRRCAVGGEVHTEPAGAQRAVGSDALSEDQPRWRGDRSLAGCEASGKVAFADRTSTATMRANQLRLWLSSYAYVCWKACGESR